MPHKPRLHVPGSLYHVMLRGVDGQDIFVDDSDRLRLEALVADGVQRFGHRIHAYCWMGNHIHLALQVDNTPLSKIMHNMSFRYASYFNWRHQRVGHLFQGRFRSILVDSDGYLLQLVRWRYLRFVAMSDSLQDEPDFKRGTKAGALIGSEQFVLRILNLASASCPTAPPDLLSVCRAVGTAAGISEQAFLCRSRSRSLVQARAVAAYLLVERKAGHLTELARHLDRDAGNLSRAAESVRRASAGHAMRTLALCAERILDSTVLQA